jgi:hypothetical protein
MRNAILVAAVACGLAFAPAKAQSLEKTYANLCSNKEAAKSESCVALRKALLEKLNAAGTEPGSPTGARAKSAAAQAVQPPEAAPAPPSAQELRERWGVFLDVLDKPLFAVDLESGTFDPASRFTFKWEVPGEVMTRTSFAADGSPGKVLRYRWDEAQQRVVLPLEGAGDMYLGTRSNGEVIGLLTVGTAMLRTVYSRAGNAISALSDSNQGQGWVLGRYELYYENTEANIAAARQSAELLTRIYKNRKATAEGMAQMQGSMSDAEFQQYLAELDKRAKEAQARRQARKEARGQMLGSLLVAGVGAATAQAYGGDASQVVGGAMKGYHIANPDSAAAAAMGGLADSLITKQGAGTGAGPSAGAAGAGASYPVEPPVDLSEACPGFTDANYRTRAVNAPGDDAHLYAACGQAFELYHMYRNAIRQGYSQTDAMRTYNAHKAAAANAQDYYRTRRAN